MLMEIDDNKQSKTMFFCVSHVSTMLMETDDKRLEVFFMPDADGDGRQTTYRMECEEYGCGSECTSDGVKLLMRNSRGNEHP
jgi:hypothetical protein